MLTSRLDHSKHAARDPASIIPHTRKVITPVDAKIEGFEGAGMGRIITYNEPIDFTTVFNLFRKSLEMRQRECLECAALEVHTDIM